MRPRPRPRQLHLPQPPPRPSPPARHFPVPPLLSLPVLCSSFQASLSRSPLFFSLPVFPRPTPLPSSSVVSLPSTPPFLPSSSLYSSPSLFLPRVRQSPRLHLPVLLSAPSPALPCCWPSPPPRCPVWPEDKSQGETSKDKQGAVTSLSSLICHFSSSHKGQSRHGLNSGLTRRLSRRPAFSTLSLSNHSDSPLLWPSFLCRGSGSRFFSSLPLLSPRNLSLPPSFLFHLNCGLLSCWKSHGVYL